MSSANVWKVANKQSKPTKQAKPAKQANKQAKPAKQTNKQVNKHAKPANKQSKHSNKERAQGQRKNNKVTYFYKGGLSTDKIHEIMSSESHLMMTLNQNYNVHECLGGHLIEFDHQRTNDVRHYLKQLHTTTKENICFKIVMKQDEACEWEKLPGYGDLRNWFANHIPDNRKYINVQNVKSVPLATETLLYVNFTLTLPWIMYSLDGMVRSLDKLLRDIEYPWGNLKVITHKPIKDVKDLIEQIKEFMFVSEQFPTGKGMNPIFIASSVSWDMIKDWETEIKELPRPTEEVDDSIDKMSLEMEPFVDEVQISLHNHLQKVVECVLQIVDMNGIDPSKLEEMSVKTIFTDRFGDRYDQDAYDICVDILDLYIKAIRKQKSDRYLDSDYLKIVLSDTDKYLNEIEELGKHLTDTGVFNVDLMYNVFQSINGIYSQVFNDYDEIKKIDYEMTNHIVYHEVDQYDESEDEDPLF
jgi:hypothetical protein